MSSPLVLEPTISYGSIVLLAGFEIETSVVVGSDFTHDSTT